MRIRTSDLDWTIVRPPNLTDGEFTGVYRIGFPKSWKEVTDKMSRADVADFMLKQITDFTYLRKAPAVYY